MTETASEARVATEPIDAHAKPARGRKVRCNAHTTAPQRTPHAPDTAWGKLRQPTGWSLRELESRTGINAGELSRIERGRSCPTPEQARRILAAFDGAGA